MEKAQYAIMRFAKYKGPEIGNIEAHNERTKEKYASNPDVDTSRSKYNFHLVKPPGKYRAESERQIAAAGCRTRKDSIRMIETLFTASPEFFKGKKRAEIRVFFEEALHFLEQHQSKETIATVYKGNIIKNLIMDCQSYTKYRPNETTGGIFVSWRRKEELPTGA